MIQRRTLLKAIPLLFAAPAIVRASSLMHVKSISPMADLLALHKDLQDRAIQLFSDYNEIMVDLMTHGSTMVHIDDTGRSVRIPMHLWRPEYRGIPIR